MFVKSFMENCTNYMLYLSAIFFHPFPISCALNLIIVISYTIFLHSTSIMTVAISVPITLSILEAIDHKAILYFYKTECVGLLFEKPAHPVSILFDIYFPTQGTVH